MPLIVAIGTLISSVVTSIGKTISVETLKWLAFRAFMLFIVFVAVPIVLYNVATDLIFDFIDYAMSYISGSGVTSYTVQLTGLGAYIAQKIRLVEAISIMLTFTSIRFLMRFIPFFK